MFDDVSAIQGARWREPGIGGAVLFRSDGALVVCGSALAIVDTQTGVRSKLSKPLFGGGECYGVAAVAVGNIGIVAMHGEATRGGAKNLTVGIDLTTGQLLWKMKKPASALISDGQRVFGVVASSENDIAVGEIDATTGSFSPRYQHDAAIAAVAVGQGTYGFVDVEEARLTRVDRQGNVRHLKLGDGDAKQVIHLGDDRYVVLSSNMLVMVDSEKPLNLMTMLVVREHLWVGTSGGLLRGQLPASS